MSSSRVRAVLVLALALAACDDAGPITAGADGIYSEAPIAAADARVPGALRSGERVVLFVGDTARIVVTPRDASGNPVRVRQIEFVLGDSASGFTVDGAGLVRATAAPGGGVVWARVNGQFVTDTVRLVVLPRNDTPRIGGRWRLTVVDDSGGATLEGVVQVADSLLPSANAEDRGIRFVALAVMAAYCDDARTPRCGPAVAWPLTRAPLDATGYLSYAARSETAGVVDDLAFVLQVRGGTVGGRAAYQRRVQGIVLARAQGPVSLVR